MQTDWPDQPFGPVDGVREASGDPAAVARLVADADVLLTHLGPVPARVFQEARHLRVVGVTRGGPVNVDLDAATGAGVPVVYLPGRNLEAVAEYTVGLMIALPRAVPRSSRALRDGRWDASYFRYELTGPELAAATVGVIGAGAVGRRVADLVAAFGSRVLVHDPYVEADTLRAAGFHPVSFEQLLAGSDIVTVHARLTDSTRRMFDAAAFRAMRPGAWFVNTARGELVDQHALLGAIEDGHVAGAALDVFDPEPPQPDDPLLQRPEVLATPHLAGASREVATGSAARVAREVAHYLRTGEIEHCANPGWSGAAPTGS
jgi:D-3-phosphoglycerate dehydrogenase